MGSFNRRGISSLAMSPSDFLEVHEKFSGRIVRSEIEPAKIGSNGFGSIIVTFKSPSLVHKIVNGNGIPPFHSKRRKIYGRTKRRSAVNRITSY